MDIHFLLHSSTFLQYFRNLRICIIDRESSQIHSITVLSVRLITVRSKNKNYKHVFYNKIDLRFANILNTAEMC